MNPTPPKKHLVFSQPNAVGVALMAQTIMNLRGEGKEVYWACKHPDTMPGAFWGKVLPRLLNGLDPGLELFDSAESSCEKGVAWPGLAEWERIHVLVPADSEGYDVESRRARRRQCIQILNGLADKLSNAGDPRIVHSFWQASGGSSEGAQPRLVHSVAEPNYLRFADKGIDASLAELAACANRWPDLASCVDPQRMSYLCEKSWFLHFATRGALQPVVDALLCGDDARLSELSTGVAAFRAWAPPRARIGHCLVLAVGLEPVPGVPNGRNGSYLELIAERAFESCRGEADPPHWVIMSFMAGGKGTLVVCGDWLRKGVQEGTPLIEQLRLLPSLVPNSPLLVKQYSQPEAVHLHAVREALGTLSLLPSGDVALDADKKPLFSWAGDRDCLERVVVALSEPPRIQVYLREFAQNVKELRNAYHGEPCYADPWLDATPKCQCGALTRECGVLPEQPLRDFLTRTSAPPADLKSDLWIGAGWPVCMAGGGAKYTFQRLYEEMGRQRRQVPCKTASLRFLDAVKFLMRWGSPEGTDHDGTFFGTIRRVWGGEVSQDFRLAILQGRALLDGPGEEWAHTAPVFAHEWLEAALRCWTENYRKHSGLGGGLAPVRLEFRVYQKIEGVESDFEAALVYRDFGSREVLDPGSFLEGTAESTGKGMSQLQTLSNSYGLSVLVSTPFFAPTLLGKRKADEGAGFRHKIRIDGASFAARVTNEYLDVDPEEMFPAIWVTSKSVPPEAEKTMWVVPPTEETLQFLNGIRGVEINIRFPVVKAG